jgi:hypothetical protein
VDNSPTQKESNNDISRVMNPCYDTRQTGDKTENKKEKCDARLVQQYMECPPRCAPEHRMSRGERIIRKVIDERWQTRHALWPWTDRKEMIDDPIESKRPHDMPKEIKGNMFRSIIFERHAIEPKSYQKKPKENGL